MTFEPWILLFHNIIPSEYALVTFPNPILHFVFPWCWHHGQAMPKQLDCLHLRHHRFTYGVAQCKVFVSGLRDGEERCHPQVDNINQEPQLTSFMINNSYLWDYTVAYDVSRVSTCIVGKWLSNLRTAVREVFTVKGTRLLRELPHHLMLKSKLTGTSL